MPPGDPPALKLPPAAFAFEMVRLKQRERVKRAREEANQANKELEDLKEELEQAKAKRTRLALNEAALEAQRFEAEIAMCKRDSFKTMCNITTHSS